MRTLCIETPTHGRILIQDSTLPASSRRLLVGFHGYAQDAEDMLSELERIPGAEAWTLVSIQALHRFYVRGDEKVVASWMTRQDREFAVADNVIYVDRVIDAVLAGMPHATIVYVGFSQGVAMAYRAAVLGSHPAHAVIAVGGDVPPEMKTAPVNPFPEIHIAAGERDRWYTEEKLHADEKFLVSHGVRPDIFRYPGAHEWTDELREYIGRLLHQQSILKL